MAESQKSIDWGGPRTIKESKESKKEKGKGKERGPRVGDNNGQSELS